jgi:hypothetical protein
MGLDLGSYLPKKKPERLRLSQVSMLFATEERHKLF